jgi:hypothetical protein
LFFDSFNTIISKTLFLATAPSGTSRFAAKPRVPSLRRILNGKQDDVRMAETDVRLKGEADVTKGRSRLAVEGLVVVQRGLERYGASADVIRKLELWGAERVVIQTYFVGVMSALY